MSLESNNQEANLIGIIEQLTNEVMQMREKLDEIHTDVKKQGNQLSKIQEAFDLIMRDYFTDLAEGMKNFSELTQRMVAKENVTAEEAVKIHETLSLHAELLKKRTEIVEEPTVNLSSEAMKAIYREIIPEVKSLLDALHLKIEDNIVELNQATNGTIEGNRETIMESLRIVNDNMPVHVRNIINRMNDAETNIKRSMPGKRTGASKKHFEQHLLHNFCTFYTLLSVYYQFFAHLE